MKTGLLILLLWPLLALGSFNASDYEPMEYEFSKLNPSSAMWASYGFKDYSFVIKQTGCWCFHYLTRVYVINNKVVHTDVLETTSENPGPDTFKTIDGYIEEISKYYSKNPSVFSVRYDRSLGFPREFYVDPLGNSRDDENGYTIYEVVPLQRKIHN